MIVIGVGSTKRATVADIVAVIEAASVKAGVRPHVLAALSRGGEIDAAFREAASHDSEGHSSCGLDLELFLLAPSALLPFAPVCVTHSLKSMQTYGVPSVAEALAFAAIGIHTGQAKPHLILPRICGRNTTAAVVGSHTDE